LAACTAITFAVAAPVLAAALPSARPGINPIAESMAKFLPKARNGLKVSSPVALAIAPSAEVEIAAGWLVAVISEEHRERLIERQTQHLAAHRVGNRPNRIEPRAIKRRPKPHDYLMEPRKQARARLLKAPST
jgi:hypothetical protein